MINNVTLVGRLTKDPELKYSQSGTAIARFTLAVNRQYKREGQPDADFISCIAFSKTAENLCNFMSKGSQIGVVGNIQTGSYEKDGQRVYTTDVIANNIQFLESKSNSQQNQQPQQQQNNYGYQQQAQQQNPFNNQQQTQQQAPQQGYNNQYSNNGPIEITDDDLPF